MENLKYREITEKIIGASMKVHAAMGNGFQEYIYQRALAIELEAAGLHFQKELDMPFFTKASKLGKEGWTFGWKKRSWWN